MEPLVLPPAFGEGSPSLRLPTADDVDRITEICQDAAIQRFTRIPIPYERQHAEAFITMAAESAAAGTGVHLLSVDDGRIVGCAGVVIDTFDRVGSVGYWTAPEARRRGLTVGAVRRLCDWLLGDGHVMRMELHAAVPNTGSNAVAASAGFHLEATRRSAMRLRAVDDLSETRVDGNIWARLPE